MVYWASVFHFDFWLSRLRSRLQNLAESSAIVTVVFLIAGILVRRYLLQCKKQSPPGPPASLFSGGVGKTPKGHPWKIYHEWSQKWGSVLFLRLFGRDVFVFNGVQVARDLLEKRSKIYCDRPTWTMADLIGRQDNVGFTYYGESLKSARKLLHSALGPHTRASWSPMLEDQTLNLIRQLIASNDAWEPIIKSHVASVVVRFTYGTEITEEYVKLSEEINRDTGLALQPGWAVDLFPFCGQP
ncbi:cytochrome P450 [Chiua virens]|nr:cytochrome P450 [Chiua virens]